MIVKSIAVAILSTAIFLYQHKLGFTANLCTASNVTTDEVNDGQISQKSFSIQPDGSDSGTFYVIKKENTYNDYIKGGYLFNGTPVQLYSAGDRLIYKSISEGRHTGRYYKFTSSTGVEGWVKCTALQPIPEQITKEYSHVILPFKDEIKVFADNPNITEVPNDVLFVFSSTNKRIVLVDTSKEITKDETEKGEKAYFYKACSHHDKELKCGLIEKDKSKFFTLPIITHETQYTTKNNPPVNLAKELFSDIKDLFKGETPKITADKLLQGLQSCNYSFKFRAALGGGIDLTRIFFNIFQSKGELQGSVEYELPSGYKYTEDSINIFNSSPVILYKIKCSGNNSCGSECITIYGLLNDNSKYELRREELWDKCKPKCVAQGWSGKINPLKKYMFINEPSDNYYLEYEKLLKEINAKLFDNSAQTDQYKFAVIQFVLGNIINPNM